MKFGKRFYWIVFSAIFVMLAVLILTQVKSVEATFSNLHAIAVLLRVETEVMQKAPAGQHYESLFWKHNDELMQIARDHPENNAEFWRVTRLFIPNLEALLDGKGDTVQIAPEQVESLKAELDWLASVGSSSLQADIYREEERFPLDQFIGMTMNEALDFINSNWSPDEIIEKPLVPDSGGRWTYYVYDGVYLEYPASYNLQVSQTQKDFVYFMPSFGIPDGWNPCVIRVSIRHIPMNERDANNPRLRYAPESIVWENSVQNAEFPGVEFISSRSDRLTSDFHSFQYNEEQQLAIDILLMANENFSTENPVDYSEMVKQRYEYFQHMTESLRIP